MMMSMNEFAHKYGIKYKIVYDSVPWKIGERRKSAYEESELANWVVNELEIRVFREMAIVNEYKKQIDGVKNQLKMRAE